MSREGPCGEKKGALIRGRPPLDADFFERFPERNHRLRLATQAETAHVLQDRVPDDSRFIYVAIWRPNGGKGQRLAFTACAHLAARIADGGEELAANLFWRGVEREMAQ